MASDHLVATCVLIFGMLVATGFLQTPEVDRTAIEGGYVVLRCDTSYDRTKDFYWVEKDTGYVLIRHANADVDDVTILPVGLRGRLSLVGVDSVDLRIDNVKKADEGSYNCQQKHAEQKGTLQRLHVANAAPSRRLSGGEIAGIVIGSILGLGLVIVVTAAITRHFYNNSRQATSSDQQDGSLRVELHPAAQSHEESDNLLQPANPAEVQPTVTDQGGASGDTVPQGNTRDDAPLPAPVEDTGEQGTWPQAGGDIWHDVFIIVERNLPAQNWHVLARAWGLTHEEIANIDRYPHYELKDKLSQVLMWWRRRNTSPETLADALRECEFHEVADRVIECCRTFDDRA